MANTLFDLGEVGPEAAPGPAGSPRRRYAHRLQAEMRVCARDSLIPEDHPVPVV